MTGIFNHQISKILHSKGIESTTGMWWQKITQEEWKLSKDWEFF